MMDLMSCLSDQRIDSFGVSLHLMGLFSPANCLFVHLPMYQMLHYHQKNDSFSYYNMDVEVSLIHSCEVGEVVAGAVHQVNLAASVLQISVAEKASYIRQRWHMNSRRDPPLSGRIESKFQAPP